MFNPDVSIYNWYSIPSRYRPSVLKYFLKYMYKNNRVIVNKNVFANKLKNYLERINLRIYATKSQNANVQELAGAIIRNRYKIV